MHFVFSCMKLHTIEAIVRNRKYGSLTSLIYCDARAFFDFNRNINFISVDAIRYLCDIYRCCSTTVIVETYRYSMQLERLLTIGRILFPRKSHSTFRTSVDIEPWRYRNNESADRPVPRRRGSSSASFRRSFPPNLNR